MMVVASELSGIISSRKCEGLSPIPPMAMTAGAGMNEVIKTIDTRRSVRSYAPEPLSEALVREIIRCGTRAPNGCNAQPLRFVVITDKAVLHRYNTKAKTMFGSYLDMQMKADPSNVEAFRPLKKMMDDPAYDMFHGAPCLVLVFTSPNAMSPTQDGALCAGNMMLAAHSMGIGSLWVGFASPLGKDPEVLRELNVPQDHVLQAQLIFGHPAKDTGVTPRNEPVILKWM